MKRTIPAQQEVICDACGRKCGPWPDASRVMNGEMEIKRDALDHFNQPVASANLHLDLCDDCLKRISAAVNAEAERIRAENPKKEKKK